MFDEKLYELFQEMGIDASKSKVKKFKSAFFKTLTDYVNENNTLIIKGFGTFKKVTLSPRKINNTLVGKELTIPERQSIKFKISRTLRNKLNS